jgi:hypothetical protein
LARLPGEAAIRTVLIFAPVTLLAIIILAVLYAVEKPSEEVTRPAIAQRGGETTIFAWMTNPRLNRIGWWGFWITIPLALGFVALRSAAFLSPSKFENFLGRLPAGSLFQLMAQVGPFLVLVLFAGALLLIVSTREEPASLQPLRRWFERVGPIRMAISLVLAYSLPLLLMSVLAVVAFFLRPNRMLALIERLSDEVILRFGLVFISVSLFIVVVLAILFLAKQGLESREMNLGEVSATAERSLWGSLQRVFSWLLVGGLAIAGATLFGIIVGAAVLVLK